MSKDRQGPHVFGNFSFSAKNPLKTGLGNLLSKKPEPPLSKIYLEPTTQCNLDCPMCMRHWWDENGGKMPMEVFGRLMDGLGGVRTVKSFSFWGIGEPLMHEGIFEMIRAAKEFGAQTEMITNGTLLTLENCRKLLRAGLDVVIISLEGTSPEFYEESRQSDFHTLTDNLGFLNEAKKEANSKAPEIGLEFVASARNISQMPGLGEVVRRVHASFVLVSNLLPYGGDTSEDILYWLSTGANTHDRVPVGSHPALRLPRMDSTPQCDQAKKDLIRKLPSSTQARSFSAKGFCPFVGRGSVAVRWDGAVSPCIPLMHSHRCMILGRPKAVTRYQVGHLGANRLSEIWEAGEYQAFRKRVLSFDFPPCNHCDCDLAQENLEDCCGSPFPTCGDCLWAQNIVVCP